MADSKVDLGAASSDFSGMSMNEAFGLEPGDEGYMGLFPGPVYKEGDVIDDDPYRDAVEFERSADRVSPYEGFAETRSTMTDTEFFPSLIDGKLFPNNTSGKTGRHVPYRPQLEADGSVTLVPIGFQEGGEPSREQAFAVAESSKRENAIQMLNALSEEELIERFGLQGYQRLLADAGILDFGSIQIQPQIDAAASGLEATSELGPFELLQQQQRGQGRLGFAADVDDFGTFGAGVTGGFMKGETRFPEQLQRMGAPSEIKYGTGKLSPSSFDAFYQFPRGGPRITGQYMPSETGEDQYAVQLGYSIPFQEGGSVEEAGIMGALLRPSIDLPDSASQDIVRQSAREGSEGASMFYPEGALTFEQVLETKYGYPADVDRSDFETTSELMRAERPRYDLPTYQEMEDARAHALQTALLAQQVGPETAQGLGSISEFVDKTFLGATSEDVAMDKRNNAFGAQLLKKAGINATPQQITKMVDQAVFDQLDAVLGREPGERRFKSPDTGIDIFFPRDKYGYFNVNRYD